MTGRVPSSPAPGPRQASGSMSSRHSKNTMTAKERDMGTQEPMQFTCSSFGQQGEEDEGWGGGAIKILQINYTKKKKRQIIYKKSVQGLHFAVIICTNSARKERTSKGQHDLPQSQTGHHDLKIPIRILYQPS